MDFYLSFGELAAKLSNPVTSVFLPTFLVTTVLEAVVIIRRSGSYPGRMLACRSAWHSGTSSPRQSRAG